MSRTFLPLFARRYTNLDPKAARPFEQALSLSVLVYHLLPGWPFAKHSPD